MSELNTPTENQNASQLAAFVGRQGATMHAPDAVNAAMIRHWCVALGDHNPVYLDDAVARASGHGGVIAPPAMLQAWTMPGYLPGSGAVSPGPDAIAELYALLDGWGYTSIVATDSEQDYLRPLRLGDKVSATKTITSISVEKRTGLGKGHFVSSTINIVDGSGALVGRQLHRVLKFKPAVTSGASVAPVAPAAIPALRPRPNVTQDTRFFFDGAREHKLLIQRCTRCGVLQHPPTPACAACGSLELGVQQASGRGTLYSYTVVHAPVVAPFKAPYTVALVALEEGTRVVSELLDVPAADVHIGMQLEVDFLQADEGLVLPVFRAAIFADGGDSGDRLPPLSIPLTRSLIGATATASRDYHPVHHDPDAARRGGSLDVFMNIITTQGLVGRYITDWAGPTAVLRSIHIRLGSSNYPGDTMVLTGQVTARKPGADGLDVEVAVRGANRLGEHVKGRVTLTLPAAVKGNS